MEEIVSEPRELPRDNSLDAFPGLHQQRTVAINPIRDT
jgi:hypothetical protein